MKLHIIGTDGLNYYYTEKRDLYYEDEKIQKNGNWIVSEKSIDVSKIYRIRQHSEFIGFKLVDNIPEYIDVEKLETPEEDDYDFEFFEKQYNRFEEYEYLFSDSEYRTVKCLPPIEVDFNWSSDFPACVREYKELHHNFPCRVAWGSNYAGYEKIVEQFFEGRVRHIYVNSKYVSVEYFNIGRVEYSYGDIQASNLHELEVKFRKHMDDFRRRISRDIVHDKIGFLNDKNIPPFDRDMFLNDFRSIKSKMRNSSKKSELRSVMTSLDSFKRNILSHLDSIAAWEKPEEIKKIINEIEKELE